MVQVSKKSIAVAGVLLAAMSFLASCGKKSKGGRSGGGSDATEETATEAEKAKAQASVAAFQETVYPIVTQYCNRCHEADVAPFFAQPDAQAAHDILTNKDAPKVDLGTPEKSILYIRLAELEHNCWSTCEEDAPVMLEAITAWGDKVGAEAAPYEGIQTEPVGFATLKAEAPTFIVDPLSIVVEAETATLAGAMAVVPADGTSGGSTLGVANGANPDAIANAANSTDIATFTFDVKTAGDYRFFAKATAPTNADDQVHVSINNAAPVNWTLSPTDDSAYLWNPARNGNAELPAVTLPVGPVTVQLRRNEAGAMIDVVALTADTTFTGGSPREAEVRVLRLPMPADCNTPGATFEVEVADYNEGAYIFKYPRLKIGTSPVHVKGIGILLNGHFNPQYATYQLVDETVGPDHAAAGLLSKGAMVVLKDKGPAEDTFAFTFAECGVK